MGFEAAAGWRAEKPDRKLLNALTGVSAAWILLDLSLFGAFSTGPVSVGALLSLLLWTLCLCLLWVGVIPGAAAAQAALAAILVVGYIPLYQAVFLVLMSAVVAMYAPVWPRRLYVVTSVLWTGAVGAQFGDWETAAGAAAFLSLLVLIAYAIGRGIRRVAARAREERTQRLRAEQARAHALQHERRRFAQELHDNIGRDLTVLAMRADAMSLHPHAPAPEAVQVLGDTARSALDDLREMVILLKGQGVLPQAVDGRTFPEDLETLRSGLRPERGVFEADVRGDWSRVAQWVRTQLFAIVGEGLLNAQKHGAAPDGGIAGIRLDAEAAADAWSVTIENDAAPVPDGQESFPYGSSSVGLEGMHVRAQSIGARLEAGPSESDRWVLRVSSSASAAPA